MGRCWGQLVSYGENEGANLPSTGIYGMEPPQR